MLIRELRVHVVGYIICWCWLFVNPLIYILGSAHIRSAFKFTFGLKKTDEDTTYMSQSRNHTIKVSLASLQTYVTPLGLARSVSKSASANELTAVNRNPSIVRTPTWPSINQVLSTRNSSIISN